MLEKYLIPLAIFIVVSGLIIWGFFAIWNAGFKKVVYDWSTDKTGRHVAGNGFRIIAFAFLMLITLLTSFEVRLEPFHITPKPMPAEVLLIWLVWIGGESLLSYLRNKVPGQSTTVKVESENTNIGPINPKPDLKISELQPLKDVPKDADILRVPDKKPFNQFFAESEGEFPVNDDIPDKPEKG